MRIFMTGLCGLGVLLSGCAIQRPYEKPNVVVPTHYREASDAVWQPAQTITSQHSKSDWWTAYQDPALNALQRSVLQDNQTLQQIEARQRQAQALSASARAALWPTLGAQTSVTRRNASTDERPAQTTNNDARNSYAANLNLAWEIDLWGRLRASEQAQEASLAASIADVQAARLSVQTDLAIQYFSLRTVQAQQRLLSSTVDALERARALTANRYASGVAAKLDLIQAETQLNTTRAQLSALASQQAQLMHALAVLVGSPPANFQLPSNLVEPLPNELPEPTVSLPSQLLERRPDIAAAERRVAAANAQIGVAQAAYFPSFSFSAGLGFQSNSFADWLTAPNRVWSLGPALAATLFDGGKRRAASDQALAAYDETVAQYRQIVLTSFQEVEDALSNLRFTREQLTAQRAAAAAAQETLQRVENQYRTGTVDYLNVTSAQTTALNLTRAVVVLEGQQQASSVQLVKALGGWWE